MVLDKRKYKVLTVYISLEEEPELRFYWDWSIPKILYKVNPLNFYHEIDRSLEYEIKSKFDKHSKKGRIR